VTLNVEGITALLILLAQVSWRRGRSAASGMWAGMGAAFKLVPVFILPPLIAASSWRAGIRTLAATAAVWLAINIPYVLIDPAGFRFPYQFALRRQDVQETIWAVVGLSGELAAVASLITLGAACLATAVAIRRGRITPESGCALALLACLIWTAVAVVRSSRPGNGKRGRGKGTSLISTVCEGKEPRGHARKRLMQAA